jgi:hypothetical protein
MTFNLILVILNLYTAVVGQTALLSYYKPGGNCYPRHDALEDVKTRHKLMYTWIFCQVLIFYGNFFGQFIFMLAAKTCGIFTIKEKCNVLDERDEIDFLEYCHLEVQWFIFFSSEATVFFGIVIT